MIREFPPLHPRFGVAPAVHKHMCKLFRRFTSSRGWSVLTDDYDPRVALGAAIRHKSAQIEDADRSFARRLVLYRQYVAQARVADCDADRSRLKGEALRIRRYLGMTLARKKAYDVAMGNLVAAQHAVDVARDNVEVVGAIARANVAIREQLGLLSADGAHRVMDELNELVGDVGDVNSVLADGPSSGVTEDDLAQFMRDAGIADADPSAFFRDLPDAPLPATASGPALASAPPYPGATAVSPETAAPL